MYDTLMENTTTPSYVRRKVGIQKGTCATDALARSLDDGCKTCVASVLSELQERFGDDVTFEKKLKASEIPGGIGACQPDGGLWYYKGKLIAAFEAKKQGDGGNAIERWFKNNYICRLLAPNISYVTFAAGPGASRTGVIQKTLNVAHLEGVNKLNVGGNSLFLCVEGFTPEQIRDTMLETLLAAIQLVN